MLTGDEQRRTSGELTENLTLPGLTAGEVAADPHGPCGESLGASTRTPGEMTKAHVREGIPDLGL
jgi:hypothetical protein